MAHGSHSSHNDKSLELGYQEDNVQVATLIKFLIGLAVFTAISMGLMYGLKVALEAQAEAEDKAAANPLAYSAKDLAEGKNLPPEPRLQAAPGFGVTLQDGKRVDLRNQAPQSEYWVLNKEWQHILEHGVTDEKTGTVIALPIEEAKKLYLSKNPPAREGTTEVLAPAASDTSAGRTPGVAHHAAEPQMEGPAANNEKKEADANAKPAPSATPAAKPAAKAAGAH